MQTFSIAVGDYAGFSFRVNPNNTSIVEISHVAAWDPTNDIGSLRHVAPSYDPSSPTLEGRYAGTSRITTSQNMRDGRTPEQAFAGGPNATPQYAENSGGLGNQRNDPNYVMGRDNLPNQQERRDEAGDYHIVMEFNRNGGLIGTLRIPVENVLELRRDLHTGRPRRATEAELNAEEELRLDREHAIEDQKKVADEKAEKLKQSRNRERVNATPAVNVDSGSGIRPGYKVARPDVP